MPDQLADERHRLRSLTQGDIAEDVHGVVRVDDGVPVRDRAAFISLTLRNRWPQNSMMCGCGRR